MNKNKEDAIFEAVKLLAYAEDKENKQLAELMIQVLANKLSLKF